ncbi:MAG: hypothetical protein AAGF25_10505 [Pseudomonadota bacterium]
MKTEETFNRVEVVTVSNEEPSMAVENLEIDDFELGLLTVARYFLDGLKTNSAENWQNAYIIASGRWGEHIGLTAAYYLWPLLRSVLNCNRGAFLFHDPRSVEMRSFATKDESLLVRAIHHMRRDQTPHARKAVLELCNGVIDPETVKAGLVLSARFAVDPQNLRTPNQKPHLKLVVQT